MHKLEGSFRDMTLSVCSCSLTSLLFLRTVCCSCIQTLLHAKRLPATNHSWCPPCRVGCIDNATANLAGILNPTIVTTSVCLKVRPQATQLALDLAASVRTTRRIAAETEAICEEAPTCGLEQFQLLPLAWAKLGCIPVQISTTHHWATATTRRVAGWNLTMKQAATTFDRCGYASITIAKSRRLAGACATADFSYGKATTFLDGAHATATHVVAIDTPTRVFHDVILNLVACTHQVGSLLLSLAWVSKRGIVCHFDITSP